MMESFKILHLLSEFLFLINQKYSYSEVFKTKQLTTKNGAKDLGTNAPSQFANSLSRDQKISKKFREFVSASL